MTPPARSQQVLVWRQPNGFWRWRWRQLAGADVVTELPSNEQYLDADEAVGRARTAFPEVPLVNVTAQAERRREQRRRSRRRRVTTALMLVLLLRGLRQPRSRKQLRQLVARAVRLASVRRRTTGGPARGR